MFRCSFSLGELGVPAERQFLIWLWEWSSEQGKWGFSWWREKLLITYPNVLARNGAKGNFREERGAWCCGGPESQARSWGHCHIEFLVWATCFFENFGSSAWFSPVGKIWLLYVSFHLDWVIDFLTIRLFRVMPHDSKSFNFFFNISTFLLQTILFV